MIARTKWIGAGLLAAAAVAVFVAGVPLNAEEHPQPAPCPTCAPGQVCAPGQSCGPGQCPLSAKPAALRAQLSSALAAVESAEKAVQAGNKEQALARLAEAKQTLTAVQACLAPPAKAAFANDRCPISGKPIDPAKVTPKLVRMYKGKKVAFCCGGCPPAWEKLSDAQKAAKLAAVTAPAAAGPKFLNTRCPIMGSPIDPAKVTENLTRDYHGGKVAFCCAGCPAAWDKLTDAQKAAKLKVAARP